MANLRIADDVVARFRQKPRCTIPQDTHAGQQPPLPGASSPISPSASEQRNRDAQRAQEQELHESTVKPQREGNSQGNHPLYAGGSGVANQVRQTQEAARQEIVHGATITEVRHPGASPQQKPNDSGTRGARVPG